MTIRELFLDQMKFRSPERSLKWEWAYWKETLIRWQKEGLRLSADDQQKLAAEDIGIMIGGGYLAARDEPQECSVKRYFQLDPGIIRVSINLFLSPPFEKQIVQEDAQYRVYRDMDGSLKRVLKGSQSMPQYLRYAVENRNEFEALKERLNPEDPRRFPGDWESIVEGYQYRDVPLC